MERKIALENRLKNLGLYIKEEAEIIAFEKSISLLREEKRKLIAKQVERLSSLFCVKKGDVIQLGRGKNIETVVVHNLFTKYDLHGLSGLEDQLNMDRFRRYVLNAHYYKLTKKNKIDKREDPLYNSIPIEDGVKIGEYDFDNDKIIKLEA